MAAVKKADDDHWAYLDEIEAPMWVDLTVEANSIKQDKCNDDWFLISHRFHQCSSKQLKSEFLHSGNSNIDLQGQSSPKLPSSVSKSRGKDYRSKKWGKEKHSFLSNKHHPVELLGGKTLKTTSGSGKEVKPKSSCGSSKGYSSSKPTKTCESTITNNSKPTSSTEDIRKRSNSIAIKECDRNSRTSTVTSGSSQQQKKPLDGISQTVGHTSELLSVMRITLRKSCVTRQAARVEINDGRNINGRKSSSSKSSVGSSSSYTGHYSKNKELTGRDKTETTPDSRNVVSISQEAKRRENFNNAKESNAQLTNKTSYCTKPKGGKTVVDKFGHMEAAKSKGLCQPPNRKAPVLLKVNKQGPIPAAIKAREKKQASGVNRFVAGGKENALGKKVVVRESGGENIGTEGLATTGQRMKQSEPRKGERIGLVGLKGKVGGKIEGKSSGKVIHKVHFR